MTEVFNRSSELLKRRVLRHSRPIAERLLWRRLNKRQLNGHRFRRQYGIGRYVVDFYCPGSKVVIEVDGSSHTDRDAEMYDKERQDFIESFEIKVLRFTNKEVIKNTEAVVNIIEEALIRK
jgi:very-short-patch-repair endonuclease